MALLLWVGRLMGLTASKLTSCLHHLNFSMKSCLSPPVCFCFFLPLLSLLSPHVSRAPPTPCQFVAFSLLSSPSSLSFTAYFPLINTNTHAADRSRPVLTPMPWLWQLVRVRGVWRRHQEVYFLLPVSWFRLWCDLSPSLIFMFTPIQIILLSIALNGFPAVLWLVLFMDTHSINHISLIRSLSSNVLVDSTVYCAVSCNLIW